MKARTIILSSTLVFTGCIFLGFTNLQVTESNKNLSRDLDDIVTYLGSAPTSPFPNTFAWGTTSSSMTAGNAGILLGREDNGKITFDAEL